MRIAVSGTHCSGKSTLIEAFLSTHPDFAHEPEPYEVMVEEYGEDFAAEPSADDFFRQLEFNVERLHQYQPGARVIFERSPADFLAYMLALEDLRRPGSNQHLAHQARNIVVDAMRLLEVIVLLPLNETDYMEAPDGEDSDLRVAVDSCLASMFRDDELALEGDGGPIVLEATGSIANRLRTLSELIC
jgi:predicted ATPase